MATTHIADLCMQINTTPTGLFDKEPELMLLYFDCFHCHKYKLVLLS